MHGTSDLIKSGSTKIPEISSRRVLIADSDQIFLDGLALALGGEFAIQAEATTSLECLSALKNVDILVMGFSLGCGRNALGLLPDIKSRNPSVKVIIFVSPTTAGITPRLRAAGAHGVISRRTNPQDLPRLVHAAVSGRALPPVLKHSPSENGTPPAIDLSLLTARELEVFRLIGLGKSTREIGTLLGTSEKTASSHRENLKAKLNLQGSHALNLAAISHTLWESTGTDFVI